MRFNKTVLFSLLAIGAALALVSGATFAVFTDTQTASGTVNAGTINLYLSEPADDDSGEDEVIFEVTENILPGETFTETVRLTNTGNRNWDLITPIPTTNVTPAECDAGNAGDEFTVAYASAGDPGADDHGGVIHVAPGAAQDVVVSVTLAAGAGNSCQGYVYSFTATFTVTQHP